MTKRRLDRDTIRTHAGRELGTLEAAFDLIAQERRESRVGVLPRKSLVCVDGHVYKVISNVLPPEGVDGEKYDPNFNSRKVPIPYNPGVHGLTPRNVWCRVVAVKKHSPKIDYVRPYDVILVG